MSLSSARQRRATAASPPTDDGYAKDSKDRRRRPGGDGDGEILGPREPQAAAELVDLPLHAPADAEVRAGGKV